MFNVMMSKDVSSFVVSLVLGVIHHNVHESGIVRQTRSALHPTAKDVSGKYHTLAIYSTCMSINNIDSASGVGLSFDEIASDQSDIQSRIAEVCEMYSGRLGGRPFRPELMCIVPKASVAYCKLQNVKMVFKHDLIGIQIKYNVKAIIT